MLSDLHHCAGVDHEFAEDCPVAFVVEDHLVGSFLKPEITRDAVEVIGDTDVATVQVYLGVLRFDVKVKGTQIFEGTHRLVRASGVPVEARIVVMAVTVVAWVAIITVPVSPIGTAVAMITVSVVPIVTEAAMITVSVSPIVTEAAMITVVAAMSMMSQAGMAPSGPRPTADG